MCSGSFLEPSCFSFDTPFRIYAVTRAEISIGVGPDNGSFSIGITAIARSDKANAAALSPRPMLLSARSPIRIQFSGPLPKEKGSSSLCAWFQLSWAAAFRANGCYYPRNVTPQNRCSRCFPAVSECYLCGSMAYCAQMSRIVPDIHAAN